MRHPVDIELLNQRKDNSRIESGRGQESVTDGLTQLIDVLITLHTLYFKYNFTNQRIAVGMNAGRRKTENDVAFLYHAAVNHLGLLNAAYSKAGNIIFTLRIEAVHLGSFAANKCTAGLLAGTGNALYDFSYSFRIKLAYCKIVEEEQGLRTLNNDIVYTHGYGILTDGVMLVQEECQLQLGAYAVGTGNQHRLLILCHIQSKKSSKAAEVSHDLRAIGCFYAILDESDGTIACINIYTCISVCQLLFHSSPLNYT